MNRIRSMLGYCENFILRLCKIGVLYGEGDMKRDHVRLYRSLV